MGLDLPNGHRALALGWLEQHSWYAFQLHSHQVEMAISDHTLANQDLKVVDLNFDPALLEPEAEVLACAVGQDEEQATGLSGTNEHGYSHSIT